MEPVFPFDITLPAPGAATRQRALHQQLRQAILDGRLAAGTRLPSTRAAAAALGLGRNTVVAAYDLLVAEGYVRPRTAATPVVAEGVARRPRRPAACAGGDARLAAPWRSPAIAAAPAGPGAQPFRLGLPEHRGFPHDVWRRLVARELRTWARGPFAYPPPEGLEALREAIAGHVAFTRAVACDSRDIVVTAGAGAAFDLLARLLVTPGRTRVALENPGYPATRLAFGAAGARLVPVPVDGEGLCVDRLPPDVRVVCVTPSHQSPTGVVLSLRRRRALLDFAKAQGAVIVEDDYDGEFRYGARPLDALQTLDGEGRVFYVGTFSKSLFPALRKGFVVAPAWAREALVAAKRCTDPHADALMQSVLAAFIREGHLARHVRRLLPVYAARRQVLLQALEGGLADWLEPLPSEAGLHLAARVRVRSQAARVIAAARECLPGTQPVADHAFAPLAQAALAIGFGVADAGAIVQATGRLRRALAATGRRGGSRNV